VFGHHARSEQTGSIDHGAVSVSEEGKVGPRRHNPKNERWDDTWIGVGRDKANPEMDKARFT
jgi:hypothetical protein